MFELPDSAGFPKQPHVHFLYLSKLLDFFVDWIVGETTFLKASVEWRFLFRIVTERCTVLRRTRTEDTLLYFPNVCFTISCRADSSSSPI